MYIEADAVHLPSGHSVVCIRQVQNLSNLLLMFWFGKYLHSLFLLHLKLRCCGEGNLLVCYGHLLPMSRISIAVSLLPFVPVMACMP
jgi:hypothetical protein